MAVDISIVLNAHNEGWIIYPTIISLIQAKHVAENEGLIIEIIAMLDRPDEITKEFIFSNLPNNSIIECVNFGDLGLSRNHALTLATGECVAFIDGDDLWSNNWLVKAFQIEESLTEKCILHPEVNVFFGNNSKILFHRSMNDKGFDKNFLIYSNYWTSLSFSKRSTYESIKYRKANFDSGFAWEDWQWNIDTIDKGLLHEIVPGTTHFIRSKSRGSLLERVIMQNYLPIIPINYFKSN